MAKVMSGESPYKLALDAPSRQLLWELGQLAISSRADFDAKLEKADREHENEHRRALEAAAVEHERVRESAVRQMEILSLQIEDERRRREDEEKAEAEKQRQAKVDREIAQRRAETERVQKEEARERLQAEARQVEARKAEAAAVEQQRQEQEKQAREKAAAEKANNEQKARSAAEAELQAKEAAVAATQRSNPTQNTTKDAPKSPVPAFSSPAVQHPSGSQVNSTRLAEHQRYLEIHQKLKELRKFVSNQIAHDKSTKSRVGDMRRAIKKCVGQLTEGKGANKAPLMQIITTLKEALAISPIQVAIPSFLLSPLNTSMADNDTQGPAILVYLLNIFAKAIISQFSNEAGAAPRAADPVGQVASQIFAVNEFRWQGQSLIDILLAKFHVVCPVLWGVFGDENTTTGKLRLGWRREGERGPFIEEGKHFERMTGLGAGFAALSLRSYEKSRLENPFPHHHYWRAFSAIVNVPTGEATQTHFIVLKAMIQNNETRFLEFFGDAAKIALRKALIEFPARAGRKSIAAKALAVLPDVMRRDKKLYI